MEHEGSFPCWKQTAIILSREPVKSNPHTVFSKEFVSVVTD
jgi:hypothetical protein